jgi:hypothetical protein
VLPAIQCKLILRIVPDVNDCFFTVQTPCCKILLSKGSTCDVVDPQTPFASGTSTHYLFISQAFRCLFLTLAALFLAAEASPIDALNPSIHEGVEISQRHTEKGKSREISARALGDVEVPLALAADVKRLQTQLETRRAKSFAKDSQPMLDLRNKQPRSMIDMWNEAPSQGTEPEVELMPLSDRAYSPISKSLPVEGSMPWKSGVQAKSSKSLKTRPQSSRDHADSYRCLRVFDCM